MHMRSSLHFSIAAVIVFFTCVPALAQEFHPYPEVTHEVWAGPETVFTKRVRGEKGKLIHEYRSIDGKTGELRDLREEGPFGAAEALPYYRQELNWNGKTYRLGHFTRKEGKEKFIDILLTGMNGEDLTNVAPVQPIASIPGEWYGAGRTYVDHRISPDGSKLLVYVYGIFAATEERSWACVVQDKEGDGWTSVQPHPKEVRPAKDHIIDDQGVVYVLTDKELFRLEEDKIEQFKIEVPTEGGLWAGSLHLEGSTPQIFGFIGAKYFKEPKFVFMEFDPAARSFTEPKFSDFPYLHKFEPKEIQLVRVRDYFWLTVSDRDVVESSMSMSSWSSTKDMYVCRIDLDGSLEWALLVPRSFNSKIIDQPDAVLHPKDDRLILLFAENDRELKARKEGKVKYGYRGDPQATPEREIVQMAIFPDQRIEFDRFEIDGARCKWGGIQRIGGNTFFCGRASKDDQSGYMYWDY